MRNWALSSARSVAVTHELLHDDRLEKSRFSIQAFADSKPLAPDNETPENRAMNRRVEIIISQSKADLGLTLGDDGGSETPSATKTDDEKPQSQKNNNIKEPEDNETPDETPSFIQF